MASNMRRKLLVIIFCLASITQGMYSTYFVSILTTIERIYQIQSKTAGAILSATEIGQILGSLLIAYYGGRGNKPKWIAACMTLSAVAALISITPHFLIASTESSSFVERGATDSVYPIAQNISSPYLPSDLTTTQTPLYTPRQDIELPDLYQLCNAANSNLTQKRANVMTPETISVLQPIRQQSFGFILVIFFICLLAIGFGSTAITTLGIPFIDDIVSKEESPLYLGLTIGLKIFGPALGFLLGSFCINLNLSITAFSDLFSGQASHLTNKTAAQINQDDSINAHIGAWWLGLIIISLPLLILALPMYILSKMIEDDNMVDADDFADITYQAAEDHDIGGSHDFQSHILGMDGVAVCSGVAPEDLTSNKTCFSSGIDSSSREVLQCHQDSPTHHHRQYHQYSNYGRNIGLERPILIRNSLGKTKIACVSVESVHAQPLSVVDNHQNQKRDNVESPHNAEDDWRSSISAIVDHFGEPEQNNFTNDEAKSLRRDSPPPQPSPSRSTLALSLPSYANKPSPKQQSTTIADLSTTLSRLTKNKLLLLRMLSGILHILPIAGFYTFLPKYLIEQFRITTSSASAISGLAGILFVGFGAFLGGTIVRFFNVNSKLMTRWIAASALLYAVGMIVLMQLGCSSNQTVYYGSLDHLSTDCFDLCRCSDTYNPVCANGTTYMSPCLAGCRSYTKSGDRYIFDECGCSSLPESQRRLKDQHSIQSGNMTHNEQIASNKYDLSKLDNHHINLNVATQGQCLFDCDNLIWYIIIFSISTLIHASCEVGSMMFNLRCVSSRDRPLALGLTTFSSSLLGTIPCSVIYGTIVDYTCIFWDSVPKNQEVESSRGACRAYDNDSFRFYLHAITASVMLMAFIVDCYISRRANKVDFYSDSKTDIRMKLKKSTETL